MQNLHTDFMTGMSAGIRQKTLIRAIMGDRFTSTLLVMALLTNLGIILTPLVAGSYSIHLAKQLCYAITVLQLPGYAVLLLMLSSRVARRQTLVARVSGAQMFSPQLKRMLITFQCLLFASLLCSTFLMHKQLRVLQEETRVTETQTLLDLTKRNGDIKPGWL